jgi:hypothetical protein
MYDISHAIEKLYPNSEYILTGDTYESLQWLSTSISKPSKQELEECIQLLNNEEPMRLLRIERNKRLSECDWITLRSYSQNIAVPIEWQEYMQSLRDLPNHSTPMLDSKGQLDMNSVAWPIKPTST